MIASDARARAQVAAQAGDLELAASELTAAGTAYAREGMFDDAARCRLLGAHAERRRGELAAAEGLLDAVEANEGQGLLAPGILLDVFRERAELALLAGDPARALKLFTRALEAGGDARQLGAVLRRRADVAIGLGDVATASTDLERADEVFSSVGSLEAAKDAGLRLAMLLTATEPGSDRAVAAWRRAEDDGAPAATLALLTAATVLAGAEPSDLGVALAAVRRASESALASYDAVFFAAASATEARLLEQAEDLPGAFGVLSSAYVSVRDLLGSEGADLLLGGAISTTHDRWGAEAFSQARQAYERNRAAGGG